VEVHTAVRLIGQALVQQHLDGAVHLGDYVRRAGIDVGRTHVQGHHVLNKVPRPAVAQRQPVLAHFLGPAQGVIVDVGDVLHVAHRVAEILPVADQGVKAQVGKGVAQVGRIVRGDATDIDGCHLVQRRKGLNLPGPLVIQSQQGERSS